MSRHSTHCLDACSSTAEENNYQGNLPITKKFVCLSHTAVLSVRFHFKPKIVQAKVELVLSAVFNMLEYVGVS